MLQRQVVNTATGEVVLVTLSADEEVALRAEWAASPPAPPAPTKTEIIDDEIARNQTLSGLIREVAALKGVSEKQFIADLKV